MIVRNYTTDWYVVKAEIIARAGRWTATRFPKNSGGRALVGCGKGTEMKNPYRTKKYRERWMVVLFWTRTAIVPQRPIAGPLSDDRVTKTTRVVRNLFVYPPRHRFLRRLLRDNKLRSLNTVNDLRTRASGACACNVSKQRRYFYAPGVTKLIKPNDLASGNYLNTRRYRYKNSSAANNSFSTRRAAQLPSQFPAKLRNNLYAARGIQFGFIRRRVSPRIFIIRLLYCLTGARDIRKRLITRDYKRTSGVGSETEQMKNGRSPRPFRYAGIAVGRS